MNMQSAIAVKSNGTLINNVQRRSLPRKLQKRKQKLKLPLVLLKKKRKLMLPPALLKKKRKLKLPPALLKKKRKLMPPPVPLKRNELPAEKQKPAPAKKRLPALLLTKGFQKKKLNVFLRREPEPAQKVATDATATDNSEEQKYGNIPAEEIRDKREKAVRKGYEDMLATDPDSKAAKKKKKEEAETAKAKEDVKSRKMDDYDDEKSFDNEDDDEYEYVDEYPRFRPGRIILGIISLLAFGFCIYKGFVTGLSTSGADVTSAPGMNYVIVALCMLVTALLYFIMNNRDTLFAFLIPMILYIGCAVFAFLKHGDEFELLILAGVSGVLAVISLILAIASRGGDDYDDEDDYDDPFEEEHDN